MSGFTSIRTKERERDDLVDEVERLQETKESQVIQAQSEISNLLKRKAILISQVKKLSDLYFGLKGRKEGFIEAVDKFVAQETESVRETGRSVLDRVYLTQKQSAEEAKRLSELRLTLNNLSKSLSIREEDMAGREKSFEERLDRFRLAEGDLENRRVLVTKNETDAKELLGKARKAEREVEMTKNSVLKAMGREKLKLESRERRLHAKEKAVWDRESRVVAKEKELEDRFLASRPPEEKDLALRKLEIDAKQRLLDKREKLLGDKEGRLRRLWVEIQKKQSQLPKV